MLPWRLSCTASVLASAASLQAQLGQQSETACVLKLQGRRSGLAVPSAPAGMQPEACAAQQGRQAAEKPPQQVQKGLRQRTKTPMSGNDVCS